MIPVSPECTLSPFPAVVLLAAPAGNQMHRPGDNIVATVIGNNEVNMVGCDGEIQNGQTKTLLGFKEQFHPPESVSGEFEKELSFMAPMCQVPDVSGNEMSARAGHEKGFCLKRHFQGQNGQPKADFRAIFSNFTTHVNNLAWSVPQSQRTPFSGLILDEFITIRILLCMGFIMAGLIVTPFRQHKNRGDPPPESESLKVEFAVQHGAQVFEVK